MIATKLKRPASENDEAAVKRQRNETEQSEIDAKDTVEGTEEIDSRASVKETEPNDTALSKFETLPFDVLVVLASGMSTADLLNLARTSSMMRATLMSKSSSSIWRAARRSMGIPDGPDGLSEPLFAEILFGETCFLCQGKGDHRVLEQNLRLCKECYTNKSAHMEDIIEKYYEEEYYNLPYDELFPKTIPVKDKDARSSSSDSDDDIDGYVCWDTDAFRKIVDEYLSYPPGSQEREQFLKARKEYSSAVQERVKAVNAWCEEEKLAVRDEITQRLKALGYGRDDLDFEGDNEEEECAWDALTKDYRPLTSTRWQEILPGLKDLMQDRRVTMERRQIAADYCNGDQDEAEHMLDNNEYYDEHYEGDELDMISDYGGPVDIEEAMYRAGFGGFVNSYAAQQNDDGWFF